jgi:hypothetical protein
MPRIRDNFPDNALLKDGKASYNYNLNKAREIVEGLIEDRTAIEQISPAFTGKSDKHLGAALQHLFLARTFKGDGDVPKADNPFRNGVKRVTVSV